MTKECELHEELEQEDEAAQRIKILNVSFKILHYSYIINIMW